MLPGYRFFLRYALAMLFATIPGFGILHAQDYSKRQRLPEDPNRKQKTSATMTVSSPIPAAPSAPVATNERPVVLANYTIPALSVVPNLDGVISPGEWTDALVLTPTPIFGWLGAGSKIYMKVDACYLWIAAEIDDFNYGALGSGVTDNLEIWYDQNQNGQWDSPGDGIYAIPEPPLPGYNTLNGQTVGHSWPGNPAWSGSSPTGYQWSHWPWLLPTSPLLPGTQAAVRRTFPGTTPFNFRTQIEAKIDYKNSPLQLTPGIFSNMHMKLYMGDLQYGGNVTIMGELPTTGSNYWFWYQYPMPAYMNSYTPAFVPSSGDPFDVVSITVDNGTNFAFQNGASDKIPVYVTGAPNPAPYTTAWSATLKGPAPLTTTYSSSGTATFTADPQTQTVYIPTTGLPRGFYQLDMSVTDPTVCGPATKTATYRVLITNTGEVPCVVWPGDMNNSGTCNLADRGALQNYIYEANLNPLWLSGPTRLLAGRVPPNSTPLDIFTWTAQPALPWATPQGCYMDADGNGIVNNLDVAAIKFNAGKTRSVYPKDASETNLPGDFSLSQNFPNPFNPSTQIGYELPKESFVSIRVADVLGRTVRELAGGTQSAGFRNVTFDASELPSGVYYYTMTARATDGSGSFTKTLKMTLAK